MAKQRGVRLGNPNPSKALAKAVRAIKERKAEFAKSALKSIREIQSSGR